MKSVANMSHPKGKCISTIIVIQPPKTLTLVVIYPI